MEDIPFLNNDVDFMTRTNSMLNPMNPQAGILLIGNNGIEFRAEKGSGYIQIPWQSITLISVQIFFKGLYVRGFFIETNEDQRLEFVVSDTKEALRKMKKHLSREQFVTKKSNFLQLFKNNKNKNK